MPVAEQPRDLLGGLAGSASGDFALTMIWSTLSVRSRCCAAGQPFGQRQAGRRMRRLPGRRARRVTPPLMRYLTVVHGAKRMSSWSVPSRLAPFSLSTPITVKGTFLTRISSPIGLRPPNNSRTKRLADQADLAAAEDLALVEHAAPIQVAPVARLEKGRPCCRSSRSAIQLRLP